jgi:hypothetical protein
MASDKGKPTKYRETRGGYPAGDVLISDLKPPPPGPAPGMKEKPPADSAKPEPDSSNSK